MWDYLRSDIWKLVGAVIAVCMAFLVSLKIINSVNLVNVDFATLVSVLLAFFSVGLSVAFYFKATDTSNAFYDNTYKFTQDVAGLLVKIESGFGEKLKSIDDNYGRMRGYFENGSTNNSQSLRSDLQSEKKEFEKVLDERENIIKELLAQTNLQQEERDAFHKVLQEKDAALKELNREVSRLSKRVTLDRVFRSSSSRNDVPERIEQYLADIVVPGIFKGARNIPPSAIKSRFNELVNGLSDLFLSDLEEAGYYNGEELTDEGVLLVRKIRKTLSSHDG